MQEAEVIEKVKHGEVRYTATIKLTNSKKIGFTRRDLALCFFPKKVVEKADRHYDVLTVDGKIIPFQNPHLLNRIWEIVQQKYIYNGVVKKIERHNFDWAKIACKISRETKIKRVSLSPERNRIPIEISITTDTDNQGEHQAIILSLINDIKDRAPHLTFEEPTCGFDIKGACPIPPP